MIDMHTHILPEVDDGSSNISETFEMIKSAIKVGFTDIIATSHYIEGQYEFNRIDRKIIIDALMQKIQKDRLNIKLHIGAEAYISSNLPNMLEDKIIPTLANSRYVLFEIPFRARIMYMEDVIDRIEQIGLVPIIAHPERYEIVQQKPNIVLEWIEQGALMQANYASILGMYGNKAKDILLKLLQADAIHFFGTDSHNSSFYNQVEQVRQIITKKIGKDKLNLLSNINPRNVLDNKEIEIEKPKEIKNRLFF